MNPPSDWSSTERIKRRSQSGGAARKSTATLSPRAPVSRENELHAGTGAPAPLPHRARMEQAFGLSLEPVQALMGAGASLDRFNANAITLGNQIAFRDSHPHPDQVAHELTHVLQQRGEPIVGQTGPGISQPDSAPEQEADANAARVRSGQSPVTPKTDAPRGVIYRDIKQDLEKAVAGWGTDEEAIFNRLRTASPDEIKLVRSDPQLMQDLYDDLSRSDWGEVLGLLGIGATSRIHAASEGWGTDEEGIFNALSTTSAPELRTLLTDGTVLLELRDELSDNDLGHALAIIADKFQRAAPGITFEESYHALMLYADAVDKACNHFDTTLGNNVVTGVINRLPRGHLMAASTINDVNTHIDNDNNLARVQAAFEQRWNFTSQTVPDAAGKTPAWSVSMIRKMHASLQQVPAAHVTRPTQNVSGFRLDAAKPTGGYWSAPFIGVGTEYGGDIAGLTRHEVGHSIDDKLGATSTGFKQDATNGWNWGPLSTIWETAMPNPWFRKDGSTVPAADQTTIKALLDSYVTGVGKQSLKDFAGAGHVILTYWRDDVPMIEAAKSIAGYEDKVYDHLGQVKQYGTKYFSFSVYYKYFCVYNATVQDKRVSDYSLFGHQEFFAELYEAYFEDGPGANRGRKLAGVPNWKQFFDNTVHPTA